MNKRDKYGRPIDLSELDAINMVDDRELDDVVLPQGTLPMADGRVSEEVWKTARRSYISNLNPIKEDEREKLNLKAAIPIIVESSTHGNYRVKMLDSDGNLVKKDSLVGESSSQSGAKRDCLLKLIKYMRRHKTNTLTGEYLEDKIDQRQ